MARLHLYDPDSPDAAEQLRLLHGAFDMGATLEEVVRAAAIRYNVGPLMLDLAMRPPGETRDLADFAAADPDPEFVRRIWAAFGLPDAQDPVVRVTPDAAEAILVVQFMTLMFGEDIALGVARVMGSAMNRLAETIAAVFRVNEEMPALNTGGSRADVAESYAQTAPESLKAFLQAAEAVFRRHLVNLSFQSWSTDADQVAVTHERTVCFADLVDSTEALTTMSVRQMADMVRTFEEQVWDLVTAAGGRVIKLIGDEAMFVLDRPSQACQVGLDLIARSAHPVRIGMAHGTVVNLYGDCYGQTVNLAARLVNVARRATIVASESVREGADAGLAFTQMAPLTLKGFAEPVTAFELSPDHESSK